eukprot:NODE_58_length_25774_cov_0.240545.p4 type:complete len:413 gc:universal NODE_58_length_25774_cov_0.240545:20300-21538(+)
MIIFHFIQFCFSTSIDCSDVINLALGLNMNVKQQSRMIAINDDCCSINTGVTCSNDRVTEIEWPLLHLDGTINSTAIPKLLSILILNDNAISDVFPKSLSNTIKQLDLSNNFFKGPMPSVLSTSLLYLYLHYNKLNGTLPEILPQSLTKFHMHYNKVTGSMPRVLPSNMKELSLYNNLLTGHMTNPLPKTLIDLHIDGNAMTGPLPEIPGTINILYLGFTKGVSNRFTGSLELNSPRIVYINDNFISDFKIVGDYSLIIDCDLSGNPLLEHYNDPSLKKCTKNGLYSVDKIPIESDILVESTSTKTLNKITTLKFKTTKTVKISSTSDAVTDRFLSLSSTAVVAIMPQFYLHFGFTTFEWILILVRCIINLSSIRTVVHYAPITREWRARKARLSSIAYLGSIKSRTTGSMA